MRTTSEGSERIEVRCRRTVVSRPAARGAPIAAHAAPIAAHAGARATGGRRIAFWEAGAFQNVSARVTGIEPSTS
jgi:hypothetical protein